MGNYIFKSSLGDLGAEESKGFVRQKTHLGIQAIVWQSARFALICISSSHFSTVIVT